MTPSGLTATTTLRPSSFSPDGRWLLVVADDPDTKTDIWQLPLEDTHTGVPKAGTPVVFLKTAFNERAAMLSPDGRWVAYQSDESGADEIYVRPLSGHTGKWRISSAGGAAPVWSRARLELFYQDRDGPMVTSYTASGETFVPGTPRRWTERTTTLRWFDVMPDGARVAAVEHATEDDRSHVTFVLNFFDELRRRVPK